MKGGNQKRRGAQGACIRSECLRATWPGRIPIYDCLYHNMLGQVFALINLINVFGIPNNIIISHNVSLHTLSQALCVYACDTVDHILSVNFSKPMSNHNNPDLRPI
jgi:hypothetical protein